MKYFVCVFILLLNVTAAFVSWLLTGLATRGGFWFSTPRPNMAEVEWAGLALSRFINALPLIILSCVVSFAINYGLCWVVIDSHSVTEKSKRVRKVAFQLAFALLLLLMATSIYESSTIYSTKPPYDPF
jgi:hypothetical protein